MLRITRKNLAKSIAYIAALLTLTACGQGSTESVTPEQSEAQPVAINEVKRASTRTAQDTPALPEQFNIALEDYYDALVEGVYSFHQGFMQANLIDGETFEAFTRTVFYQAQPETVEASDALPTSRESEVYGYLTAQGIVPTAALDTSFENEFPTYRTSSQLGTHSHEYLAFDLTHDKTAFIEYLHNYAHDAMTHAFSERLAMIVYDTEFEQDAKAYIEVKTLEQGLIEVNPFIIEATAVSEYAKQLPDNFFSVEGFYQFTLMHRYPFHEVFPLLSDTSVIFTPDGDIQFYQQKTAQCSQSPCELILLEELGSWNVDTLHARPAIKIHLPPSILKAEQASDYAFFQDNDQVFVGSIHHAGMRLAPKFNAAASHVILNQLKQADTLN